MLESQKAKITFVVPGNLQKELKAQIIKDGYDLRGKSRWIAEGVEFLLKLKNYPELVHLNNQMKGFHKLESVVVSTDFKKYLDAAIVRIRQKYPAMEGVQSRILRTAILQRLLRS